MRPCIAQGCLCYCGLKDEPPRERGSLYQSIGGKLWSLLTRLYRRQTLTGGWYRYSRYDEYKQLVPGLRRQKPVTGPPPTRLELAYSSRLVPVRTNRLQFSAVPCCSLRFPAVPCGPLRHLTTPDDLNTKCVQNSTERSSIFLSVSLLKNDCTTFRTLSEPDHYNTTLQITFKIKPITNCM